MADELESVPLLHRSQVGKLLSDLRRLQGRSTCPLEYKIYETKERSVYEVQMFAYPMGLTAAHLHAVENMPNVSGVHVKFSLKGNHRDAHGALCVTINLTGKRAADDGRDVKRRKDASDAPGWMERLWG